MVFPQLINTFWKLIQQLFFINDHVITLPGASRWAQILFALGCLFSSFPQINTVSQLWFAVGQFQENVRSLQSHCVHIWHRYLVSQQSDDRHIWIKDGWLKSISQIIKKDTVFQDSAHSLLGGFYREKKDSVESLLWWTAALSMSTFVFKLQK